MSTGSTKAPRPNILLITSDQQHWCTLGVINPSISTPNLEKLGQEQAQVKNSPAEAFPLSVQNGDRTWKISSLHFDPSLHQADLAVTYESTGVTDPAAVAAKHSDHTTGHSSSPTSDCSQVRASQEVSGNGHSAIESGAATYRSASSVAKRNSLVWRNSVFAPRCARCANTRSTD